MNTPAGVKQNIITVVGIKVTSSSEKFLRLPAIVGRAKIKSFQALVDRTWNEIYNWKAKFLSNAGKEILLKSVLQAILTYTIVIFLLPKATSGKLNSLLKNFWWGLNGNSSKIHWVEWSNLGVPKERKGLGCRDLHSFNIALLAKQS